MPRLASLAGVAVAALAVTTGCRTTPVAQVAAPAGQGPAPPQPTFAALYRVDCCGQRGVLVTLRSGATALAATVVVPPAGPRAELWWGPEGGWVRRAGAECRSAASAALGRAPAFSPQPLAAVLAGRLPAGGLGGPEPDLVTGTASGLSWRARLARGETRVVRFELLDGGARLVDVEVIESRGNVPGVMRGAVGDDRFTATLVEWRGAPEPPPPGWLAMPQCAGEQ